MRVEETIELARPPQEVWDFVVDPLNDPRWCPKVKSVEPLGNRRWIVRHKPVPLRPPMELRLEQREVDEPRRLSMREEDEASVFDVEYRLEPIPTGTRFTQISEFTWKKLPRFFHGTFERGIHGISASSCDPFTRCSQGLPESVLLRTKSGYVAPQGNW